MKSKIILFFIILAIAYLNSYKAKAQYFENPKQKQSIRDKLFFGGGIGLQFGSITQIEVSPVIGYKVSERFQPGISLTYSYYKNNYYSPPIDYSTFGGSLFARFFIFEGLFAQGEAEALNVEDFTYYPETQRVWIGNYLIGGGYFQKLGNRGGMYILVLWNLNETVLTPYSNPVIRLGFTF
jgi:hypothetical protein